MTNREHELSAAVSGYREADRAYQVAHSRRGDAHAWLLQVLENQFPDGGKAVVRNDIGYTVVRWRVTEDGLRTVDFEDIP